MANVPARLANNTARLLRVVNNEPYCQFQICDLNDPPEYAAISYAWGNGPEQHSIQVDGRWLAIRKNLWRLLRQVSPGLYWVDAVCINQDDLDERQQQVRLMPKIYSLAREVVAWLGPAHHGSNEVIDLLNERKKWRPADIRRLYASIHGAALTNLCGRTYWSRLWVVQELKLARVITLMCGDRTLPATAFRACIEAVGIELIVLTLKGSLWELMAATRSLHCEEPRDKVYALLGIAHSSIEPDYMVSLETLMHQVLREEHRLQPPTSLAQVQRQCEMLEHIFDTRLTTDCKLDMKWQKRSSISLWWAYDHEPIVALLLQAGIPVGERLCEAAETANDDAVRVLLTLRTELSTSLEAAARCGHARIVRLLLEAGATSTEALCAAAEAGCEEIVDLLLRNGFVDDGRAIDLAIINDHRRTLRLLWNGNDLSHLLFVAAKHDRSYIIGVLLQLADFNNRAQALNAAAKGDIAGLTGNLTAVDSQGWTVLHYALEYNRPETFHFLLDKVDINRPRNDGATPLWVATYLNQTWAVKALAHRADVNARSEYALTALHHAAKHGADEIVQLLLSANADVNVPNEELVTPLMDAALAGHVNIVRMLILHKADLWRRNRRDETALHCAIKVNHKDVVRELASAVDSKAIFLAVESGNLEIVKMFLGSGTNCKDRDGCSLLHIAAKRGHTDICRALLPLIDVDFPRGDFRTPLFEAVWANHLEVMELLIDAGADIDSRDESDWRPLHEAAEHNCLGALKLLLERGADVNVGRSDGRTPLGIAAYRGHNDMLALLKNYGAFRMEVARDSA